MKRVMPARLNLLSLKPSKSKKRLKPKLKKPLQQATMAAMTRQRKTVGSQAETLAAQYLQKLGLKILQRNLKTKIGEIDILAADRDTLVVVEVKAKTNASYGGAVEMITAAKRRKLLLLARELQMKTNTESVRVDVVAIDEFLEIPAIEYYKGALTDE